jgi:probable aminopeptidase NPEPL1
VIFISHRILVPLVGYTNYFFFLDNLLLSMLKTNSIRLISAKKFREIMSSVPVKIGSQIDDANHTVLVSQNMDGIFAKSRLETVPKDTLNLLLKETAGGVSSVFVDGFRKVSIVPITKEASRHNCSSRPDVVAKSVKPFTQKERVNLEICVRNEADILPTGMAVYRACPVVSFKEKEKKKEVGLKIFVEGDGLTEIDRAMAEQVKVVGENVRIAQALTDLPPNELNPDTFTDIVLDLARDVRGIEVKVFTDCEERGFMGLHSVGKGSMHKPRMIVLTHTIDNEKMNSETKSVALVGKGICFDSGGYSLKGSQFQIGMKRDMGGAAASFGAFMSLVSLPDTARPKTIHCVLCLAENMIGPNAFRNDDVLRLYSGKTVEINNTDAEGRLILADGLAYAHKDLGAEVLIDIATLTGAASIASGKSHASVFSLDEKLMQKTVDAGKISGDLVHELVFCPELHREGLKSPIADMKNVTGKGSDAASSVAATFLYDNLVGAGFTSNKWLHVDMASVAESGDRSTGYGVALLTKLVQSL